MNNRRLKIFEVLFFPLSERSLSKFSGSVTVCQSYGYDSRHSILFPSFLLRRCKCIAKLCIPLVTVMLSFKFERLKEKVGLS